MPTDVEDSPAPPTVLVTGSTRGIGRACAERFAAAGWSVVVHGRSAEEAADVAAALGVEHDAAISAVGFDVTDHDAVHQAMREVKRTVGPLDACVVNAGIHRAGPIGAVAQPDLETLLAVNVAGAFNTMQSASRVLRRNGAPSIVLLSSVMASRGIAGQSAYAASKAAIDGLVIAASHELGPRGIRVNAVAPGYVLTDMLDDLPEDRRDQVVASTPLGRLATPADVADVVVAVSSDAFRFVTGTTIPVDGGVRQ